VLSSNDAGRNLVTRLSPILSHRVPPHLDAMCVVNKTVKDAVGNCRIADLFVLACHRHLRGQDHTSSLIAFLADFSEVAPLG
jgi:hypothetical protein